jgi:hypothetical protein
MIIWKRRTEVQRIRDDSLKPNPPNPAMKWLQLGGRRKQAAATRTLVRQEGNQDRLQRAPRQRRLKPCSLLLPSQVCSRA